MRLKGFAVSFVRSQENTKREQRVRQKDVNFEKDEGEDEEKEEEASIINLIISVFPAICENSAHSCPAVL